MKLKKKSLQTNFRIDGIMTVSLWKVLFLEYVTILITASRFCFLLYFFEFTFMSSKQIVVFDFRYAQKKCLQINKKTGLQPYWSS